MAEDDARGKAEKLIPLFAVQQGLMFKAISEPFELSNEGAFDDLSGVLSDISIVDQEGDWAKPSPRSLSVRRAEGYRLAVAIRDNAGSLVQSLEAIDEAIRQFTSDVVGRDDALLQEIFDIGPNYVETGYLPDSIRILSSIYGEADWNAVRSALKIVAQLPVKEALPRGPMPNVPLRRAVRACRHYWLNEEGKKSWSMSALKHAGARSQNKPDNLSGMCEIFVVGILRAHCVRHSLQELSSAWSAVDRER